MNEKTKLILLAVSKMKTKIPIINKKGTFV